MRDAMITYLEQINQKAITSDRTPVTRLYYKENNEVRYVEDYSHFANENYMSIALLESLAKGKTLKKRLQSELEHFRFEYYYN